MYLKGLRGYRFLSVMTSVVSPRMKASVDKGVEVYGVLISFGVIESL